MLYCKADASYLFRYMRFVDFGHLLGTVKKVTIQI